MPDRLDRPRAGQSLLTVRLCLHRKEGPEGRACADSRWSIYLSFVVVLSGNLTVYYFPDHFAVYPGKSQYKLSLDTQLEFLKKHVPV